MRGFFLLLLLPLCTAMGALKKQPDRMEVVSRLYRDYGGEKAPDLLDQPLPVLQRSFTPGLARLLIEERHRREGPPAQLGNLDFELLSGSQDPDIHNLTFRPAGKSDVLALYRTSTGQKITIRYHLLPTADGWRIDDITYARPHCSLRVLLSEPFKPFAETFREPSLEASAIKPLPLQVSVPKHGELSQADAILNSEYRKLSTALGIDARERLTRAQRAWIRERDAFAAAHPARREEALLHATRQRVAELVAILAGPVLPTH